MRADILNPTINRLLEIFRLNKTYVLGAGNYLYDEEGRGYLDVIAQYGAVPFGYNPDFIWQAVERFRESGLPTMIQPSVPLKAVELAERLSEAAPGDLEYATFVQSGTEAVEAAIKLARSATGRFKLLSTENSFHGKTLGALSATGRRVFQTPFYAPASGFIQIPFGDLDALEAKLREEGEAIAGFLIEPIQGEGGIVVPPPGYLSGARELCRRHGVVFILDEVQTGLGRTGRMFACEKESVEPDILLLSKALGGGLAPLGVCLSSPAVWNDDYGRLHSSTFSNNNFTCAIGLAVLDRLLADDRKIIQEVKEKGDYLLLRAREIKRRWPGVIKEVRGEGLMVGLEFEDFPPEDSWAMIFLSRQGGFCAMLSGYLLNVCGIRSAPFLNNTMTIRLEPPLTIEYHEIDRLLEALDRICQTIYLKDYAWLFGYLLGDSRQPTALKDYRARTMRPVKCSKLESGEQPKNRFAFLIHYPGQAELVNATPSFEQWSAEQQEGFLEWSAREPQPELVCHVPAVRSLAGATAEGWLIGVPFGAKQMMELPRRQVVETIQEAVDMAVDLGAQIVGLGAYTSVVTQGGRDVQGRGVAITSGNSFTIAMAVEGVFKGAEMMGIDIPSARGAVVGATGSIGRVCAILLSERVGMVNLIGNPAHKVSSVRRLRTLADEMIRHAAARLEAGESEGLASWLKRVTDQLGRSEDTEAGRLLSGLKESIVGGSEPARPCILMEDVSRFLGETPPVSISVDLKKSMRSADLVITASSSPAFLVTSDCLKPGAVVCDVSRPYDVSPAVREQRRDVLVFEGGLVQLPDRLAFNSNLNCREGVNLACLSETMLLALEGDFRDFSIGSRIPLETIQYLRQLGKKHGFGLAALHCDGREITEAEISEALASGNHLVKASIS
ncbi:MAG: aminotransferase class III-fold pyridoxal phosphate-dependent enzyme [Firmicutes bacterium]|nr:aminotransferase class III-fold pyridoxal phosphate-dependent enzyme [Bacillota bacterium]